MLAMTYLLVGITGYGIMGNLPLIAIDYGYSADQGSIMSVALFFATVMMVPIGMVCDKFGSKWAITINMAGVAIAAIAFTAIELPLPMVFVCGALLGLAQTVINVPTGNSITEAFGNKDYSRKVGPARAFVPFGVAIGPPCSMFFMTRAGRMLRGCISLLLCVSLQASLASSRHDA